MQRILLSISFIIVALLGACDDVINVDLADAPDLVVVDAWINNNPEDQVVRLTYSQPYFDTTAYRGITDAVVYVENVDDASERYDFSDAGDGYYVWDSSDGVDSLGQINSTYRLHILADGQEYESTSTLNPVPPVDSVTFRFEEGNAFIDDFFVGEFWARDLPGEGDTYWIKAFKNGQFLDRPGEINIAFDGGFSEGGALDNLIFIPPIREGVNRFDEDDDGNFIGPYMDEDSLYVELHSISNEAFRFLLETVVATDREGGFAELFAAPLNNIDSNITCLTSDEEVLGFFCMSAISSNGKRLIEANIPRE